MSDDEFVDCEVVHAAAAYERHSAIVMVRFQQPIPGHEPLRTATFRFRLGYPLVGEMINRAVEIACEHNPGLAETWLRAVANTLAQMKIADAQRREQAIKEAEAILHPPA